jgi:hypothetical protein
MKKFFHSEAWAWIRIVLGLTLLITAILMTYTVMVDVGFAEEEDPYADCTPIWVLCRDDTYVCVREKPRKTSDAFGGAINLAMLKTDGKEKNGFLHVVDVAAEASTGWISKQYIVYDPPEKMSQKALVVSNGRLAARKGVNGKVRKWLKPMTEVTILYWSSEWCLTNYGYVQTEYLEWIGDYD